ncbi:DUF309 domain-containing protein [Bacillus salacetis]|uniref:DUF309 domain-containing protein n=1 Tax=Bacillus salacetis TaxID=2315464 RepID=UPI003BA15020
MGYPKEYLDFLIHFHCDRDYFECHEVLEEYWKETDPGNRSSIWVGLIQMAVGFYHFRRNNRQGASRILNKGMEILKQHPESLRNLGIDSDKLLAILKDTLVNIRSGKDYQSVGLPLTDELKRIVDAECSKIGRQAVIPPSIIHRHTMRDRTEVIRMREEALLLKQKQKD